MVASQLILVSLHLITETTTERMNRLFQEGLLRGQKQREQYLRNLQNNVDQIVERNPYKGPIPSKKTKAKQEKKGEEPVSKKPKGKVTKKAKTQKMKKKGTLKESTSEGKTKSSGKIDSNADEGDGSDTNNGTDDDDEMHEETTVSESDEPTEAVPYHFTEQGVWQKDDTPAYRVAWVDPDTNKPLLAAADLTWEPAGRLERMLGDEFHILIKEFNENAGPMRNGRRKRLKKKKNK